MLAKEKRQDDQIRMAVDYFVTERNKRRKIMVDQTKKEESGEMLSYEKEEWEKEYLNYVNKIA